MNGGTFLIKDKCQQSKKMMKWYSVTIKTELLCTPIKCGMNRDQQKCRNTIWPQYNIEYTLFIVVEQD